MKTRISKAYRGSEHVGWKKTVAGREWFLGYGTSPSDEAHAIAVATALEAKWQLKGGRDDHRAARLGHGGEAKTPKPLKKGERAGVSSHHSVVTGWQGPDSQLSADKVRAAIGRGSPERPPLPPSEADRPTRSLSRSNHSACSVRTGCRPLLSGIRN